MKGGEMEYCVIFVTCASREEAEKISGILLDRRLIACANIVDGVRSVFCWQGKRESVSEALLILKTRKDLFEEVARAVRGAHSYSVPEIIALPVVEGDAEYLKWIKDETSSKG